MADMLKDQVAVITGGANGLGRATVELFVAEGAKVVIADVDTVKGKALEASLGSAALFQQTDVSRPEEVQALVDAAVAHFGGLDIMFNNAAVSAAMHPRFLDEDFSDFDRVMRINMLGVMLGAQFAARHMAQRGGGSIINTTAISGVVAGFGLMSYRVAKAGVVQFTRSAAIDLAEYGVRVNCISPGNISTDMNAFSGADVGDAAAARWRTTLDEIRMASQPLKRRGRPEDVAKAALYLASDLSAQVTGIVLTVDGGITAGDPVNHLKRIIDARQEAGV